MTRQPGRCTIPHMNHSSFIWSVADLLRGKYKPHEYGQVILPFTVLRRMDCVLEPTKQAVLKEAAKRESTGTGVNPFLIRASGATFYNTSPMDLKAIVGDQDNVAINLAAYLHGFSSNVKDIFARFKLEAHMTVSPTQTCSTSSPRSSRRSTCIPTRSAMRTWAPSSRN